MEPFEVLLDKYLTEKITAAETGTFFSMLNDPQYEEQLKDYIGKDFLENTLEGREDLVRREKIKARLKELRKEHQPARVFTFRRVAAAAVIFILFSTGAYFLLRNDPDRQISKAEQKYKNDVAPGGNKAILTLANGKQIILDSAANGTLTQQGNTKIIKLDSGQLAYNVAGPNEEVLYNTISTPKGGQYQLILADGSKVWLNAASSLRFPTSFHKDRNVELTGEGYFEVVHNEAKPFSVTVNGMSVEDLGTHFNINAYDDEQIIKTTLLEGSVKVTLPFDKAQGKLAQGDNKILKPGQQAQVNKGNIKVADVDVDEAVAWKNGRFIFQGNNIQSVMRQLARWYDVEVKYEGSVTDEEFVGVINRSRYENISQVLEMLEKTRTVSFVINGHSITVMPFKK